MSEFVPSSSACDPRRVARTWNEVLMRLRAGNTELAERTGRQFRKPLRHKRSLDSLQGRGVVLQRPRRVDHRPTR